MRKIILSIVAIVLALAGVTACGSNKSSPYYNTICVNPLTQIRQPDYFCYGAGALYPSWLYYVPYGYVSPGYYGHVSGYSSAGYRRPANATIHTGGVPTSGGKAPKVSTGNINTNKSGTVNLKKTNSGTSNGSTNKGSTNKGSGGYKAPSGGGAKVGGKH